MHRLVQEIADEPADDSSEDGRREIAELREQALLAMKDQFKAQVWDAFWRTSIEGDKPADVAEDLGISVWAVYKARYRCIQKLKTELEGLDVPLDDEVQNNCPNCFPLPVPRSPRK